MGQTSIIIFIILSTIIFIVFVAGLFIFILQFRKKTIMHENEKQLLSLSSILKGQEEERSRLAKDLHDGLGGMLSGIKLNLSSVKDSLSGKEKDRDVFIKSISQLDNAITEMRRVAHNLMPEALLKFGLAEAIRDFCDGLNESREVKVIFTQMGDNRSIEKATEIIVYRIIQELTNNAIKYAGADNILIQLTGHELGLSITVEDDGKGFDIMQLPTVKGVGLQNVQSRVDHLKGIFDIQSSIGIGTSSHIEIPLHNESINH